jgi:hypothetical protein
MNLNQNLKYTMDDPVLHHLKLIHQLILNKMDDATLLKYSIKIIQRDVFKVFKAIIFVKRTSLITVYARSIDTSCTTLVVILTSLYLKHHIHKFLE